MTEARKIRRVEQTPLDAPEPAREERIRIRAYELFMARDEPGNADDDWFRAEAEIDAESVER